MRLVLLWITDGQPECFSASADSLALMWRGPTPEVVVVDDSGSPEYRDWLDDRCQGWRADMVHHDRRRGFGGAIASGWEAVGEADFVFHAEHDFVYRQPIPVEAMMRLLTLRPYLAQVSLLRQAVNAAELAAGGVVEAHPGDFTDCELTIGAHAEVLRWMEQRVYFTTNPSLYRGELCRVGWPQLEHSEGVFSHVVMQDGFDRVPGADVRFAVWGSSRDAPAVEHIGVRQGTGY